MSDLRTLLSGLSLLVISDTAYAQAGSPSERSAGAVEEVVVTARRREEALQDVPVAVTAIGSAQLEARSVKTLQDIQQVAPGLSIGESSRGATTATFTMRGQGNPGTAITNDPAVGVYFDEVYLGRSAGALVASVEDMASVQVLRGPQGTLFGRNNTGGAILLTPVRPDLEDFSGQFTLTGGSFNRFEYGATLNAPVLKGALGVRASYKRTRRDGIGESVITGIHSFGNLNREYGRISVRARPAQSATLDFTYDFVDIDEVGPMTVGFGGVGLGYYQNRHGLLTPIARAHVDGFTFRGEFEASEDLTFKAIVGRRLQDTDLQSDVDTTPATANDQRQFMDQNQWTAELQATGETLRDAGGLARLSYTVGFFYFTESGTDGSASPLPAGLDPLRATRYLVNYADNSSAAGYAQAEGNYGDRMFVTLGARYTKDKRDLTITALSAGRCTLLALPANTPASVCLQSGEASFGYWSYTAGVRYVITPDANVYVKYDKGQRSGGLDDTPTTIAAFDPEVVNSVELGAKMDFLDRRLRTNIALYRSKVDNVQRSTNLAAPDGSPYSSVFNVSRSRVQGLELETVLRPINHVTFEGSIAITDADYIDFRDVRPGAGFGQDLSNLIFPATPKTTYNLSATYDADVAELGRLMVRVDYAHRSSLIFDVFNSPTTAQKGYGVMNARVQLDLAEIAFGKSVSVAAYGRNLTNTKYITHASAALGGILVRAQDRRGYGVELKVEF